MGPLKKIESLTGIVIRAATCGGATCCVLAFVSHRLEVNELIHALHHEPMHFETGWIQFMILAIGLIVALLINKRDLQRSYQLGGQKGVWRSVVSVLGFFALGFLLIGIVLPSQV
jgi:hypothetical protein